jgi:hypothetical protein
MNFHGNCHENPNHFKITYSWILRRNFVAISTKIPPYLKRKDENNGNVEKIHGIIFPYVVVHRIQV